MTNRPNILLITTDQQHYNTLGITNPKIHTPNLDRLAREGVNFSRAYCNNLVCSPSRASILTGLYPAWHHCWTIGVKLPEDVPTVNDALLAHGYSTTLIGKAHFEPTGVVPGHDSIERPELIHDLDFWRNFHGPWYGFEHVETARNHGDGWLVGSHYAAWLEDVKGLANWRELAGRPPSDTGELGKRGWYWQGSHRRRHRWELPADCHYTTWTAERTIAAIDRAQDSGKPFFLLSSFQDAQIGRILDHLDALGIAGNTLIVFSTDHGHFMGEHGLIAKGPFHYEDMVRVPFIVRWPARVPAGRTSDALQSLIDLPATFLDAAGIPIPGLMQSANQLPVWTGERPSARDHVIVENRHQPATVHLRTFIDARYKLTIYRDRDYSEFFDLEIAPEKRVNRRDDPDYAQAKAQMMHAFLNAELVREPTRMPRVSGS